MPHLPEVRVADAQMWRFQQNKKRQLDAGATVAQPFMNKGLYRFSRHPNYLGEMGMWVAFYILAVAGSTRYSTGQALAA